MITRVIRKHDKLTYDLIESTFSFDADFVGYNNRLGKISYVLEDAQEAGFDNNIDYTLDRFDTLKEVAKYVYSQYSGYYREYSAIEKEIGFDMYGNPLIIVIINFVVNS